MNSINYTDVVFVIVAAALVMFMIPGLALFYGGMVRSKNVLSTTLHSYAAMVIVSLQWIFIGYSIAFGNDVLGFFGNLNFLGLDTIGLTPNSAYASTIPQILFVVFQMMFAIVTAAVISGSFAERMRFVPFIVFTFLWTTLVYSPIAHWVWGEGGWLRERGVLDFAGGFVVEINSGISGLVAAIMVGKRKKPVTEPHHVPMALIGGGILWFGWFGFNAGSALAANGTAIYAFLNTNTSAAAGAVAFVACEWFITKKATALGTISGAIAGLVAITQGAGFVAPGSAVLIGLVGGTLSFFAITTLKKKLGYDDALDAFGCHGVSGIWGAIATGLFATKSVNPNGADGLLKGNYELFLNHLLAIVAVGSFAALGTFIILKVISFFTPLKVSEETESLGLDYVLHGENAYNSLK